MVRRPSRAGLLVGIAVLLAGCQSAELLESSSASLSPGADSACGVCGRAVASSPAWVAQVVFEDGSSAYFDGTRDLFEYLLARGRYLPHKARFAIEAVFVTDYAERSRVDAEAAFFVNGSKIHGPAGRQLVPLASRKAAEALAAGSPGARVIRYDEVTPAVLRTLDRPRDKNSTWVAAGD
jgi:nitrous oxide reductase accessory protein NosL